MLEAEVLRQGFFKQVAKPYDTVCGLLRLTLHGRKNQLLVYCEALPVGSKLFGASRSVSLFSDEFLFPWTLEMSDNGRPKLCISGTESPPLPGEAVVLERDTHTFPIVKIEVYRE